MGGLKLTPAQYRAVAGGVSKQSGAAARGRSNQQEGANLEERLKAYHAVLRAEGKARVIRVNPQIAFDSRGKPFVTGKGECDFAGTVYGGRSIAFDAKSREGKSFSIDKDFAHQIEYLRQVRELGGIAGLLVFWKEEPTADGAGLCRWHPIMTVDPNVKRADGIPLEGVEWWRLI